MIEFDVSGQKEVFLNPAMFEGDGTPSNPLDVKDSYIEQLAAGVLSLVRQNYDMIPAPETVFEQTITEKLEAVRGMGGGTAFSLFRDNWMYSEDFNLKPGEKRLFYFGSASQLAVTQVRIHPDYQEYGKAFSAVIFNEFNEAGRYDDRAKLASFLPQAQVVRNGKTYYYDEAAGCRKYHIDDHESGSYTLMYTMTDRQGNFDLWIAAKNIDNYMFFYHTLDTENLTYTQPTFEQYVYEERLSVDKTGRFPYYGYYFGYNFEYDTDKDVMEARIIGTRRENFEYDNRHNWYVVIQNRGFKTFNLKEIQIGLIPFSSSIKDKDPDDVSAM